MFAKFQNSLKRTEYEVIKYQLDLILAKLHNVEKMDRATQTDPPQEQILEDLFVCK